MDAHLGTRKSYALRFFVSYAILGIGLAVLAFNTSSDLFLGVVVIMGIANSWAYGSLFQVSTIISKSATTWVFLGLAVGHFAVLLLTFLLHINAESTALDIQQYYLIGSLFTVFGFACPIALLKSDEICDGDESQKLVAESQDNTASDDSAECGEMELGSSSLLELCRRLKNELLVSFIAAFCFIVIQPFYIFVPSSQASEILPLVLFYCNTLGDFVGKQLVRIPILSVIPKRVVLWASFIRPIYTIGFFLYALNLLFLNDAFASFCLIVASLIGGYCASAAYLHVPQTVSHADIQKGNLVVTIVVYLGTYAALGASFVLRHAISWN